MNWYIFLSVTLVLLFQEGQSCLKRRSTDDVCECSDFLNLALFDLSTNKRKPGIFNSPFISARNDTLFTEGAGCDRNVTCGSQFFTYLRSGFNISEITPPSDLSNSNRNTVSLLHTEIQ